ncbi:hypothetical protein PM082_015528 [Marasmius tenuissimus]|nr:hypothetical protein PM082_015528 [Marasmius tenuissimus]
MIVGKIAKIPLRFVIVGGGITGLACAIGLRLIGHSVVVLERKSAFNMRRTEGCRIPPNLSKILYRWGLRESLRKVSLRCGYIHMLQLTTKEYLGSYVWDDELLSETEGDLSFIQYQELWDLLYRLAVRSGTEYHFDAEAVCVDPEQSFVALQTGVVVSGDVIVGADGLNGLCVQYMEDSDTPLSDTGIELTSITAPKQALMNHLGIPPSGESDFTDMFIWSGEDRSVLCFPTPDYDGEGCEGSDTRPTTSRMKSEDPLISVFAYTSDSSLGSNVRSKSTNIPMRGVLPKWVKERLVVIGSAAHPLPPGSLQSQALGVEDGAVLARLFSHINSEVQIDVLLGAFEELRIPRCDEIHTKEYGVVFYMTMSTTQAQDYRRPTISTGGDALPGSTVISADLNLEGTVEEKEIREIFSYDPVDEADRWWLDWKICGQRFARSKVGRNLGTISGARIAVHVERSITVTSRPLFEYL